MKTTIRIFLTISALFSVGCQETQNEENCPAGSLNCSCTREGVCDPGLTCASDVCIDKDPPTDAVAATDSVSDTSTDDDSNSESNTDTDGDSNSDIDNDSDSESNTDTDGDSGSDSDTDGDSDSDTDTDGDSDSDTDAPSVSDSTGNTDSESDSTSDTDSESNSTRSTDSAGESDSDVDTENYPIFETASGIGMLPTCAVAQDGQCLQELQRTKEQVCERWVNDWPLTTTEPLWTPGSGECDPGELVQEVIDDTFMRINLFRWLTHANSLTSTADTVEWDVAKACALVNAYSMQDDSHHPDSSAPCYSEEAYLGASTSLIDRTLYPPSAIVDRLILDGGESNWGELGHRRKILAKYTVSASIGYTRAPDPGNANPTAATCLHLAYEYPTEPRSLLDSFDAYPPAEVFPWEATHRIHLGTNSRMAPLQWSMTVDDFDFSNTEIDVWRATYDGPKAVDVSEYGELTIQDVPRTTWNSSGIWIQTDNDLEPGTYVVDLKNTSRGNLGYRVMLVDCGTALPRECNPLMQNCGGDWFGCYQVNDPTPLCTYRGFHDIGEPCHDSRICKPGLVCRAKFEDSDTHVCSPYCDDQTEDKPDSCAVMCPDTMTVVGDYMACKL